MDRKIQKTVAILMLIVLAFSLTGCFGQHKITYDKEYVTKCTKHAKAGETVQFETVSVCDADIYVYINGNELHQIADCVYEFVMPDNDVDIKVVIVSNGLA